jgi:hypothetical protein
MTTNPSLDCNWLQFLEVTPNEDAGSMSAHASTAVCSVVDLRTKKAFQPVSVLPDDGYGAFIPDEYLAVCENNESFAKMLSQIVFRYQTKDDGTPRLDQYRHGCYWLAYTYEEWGVVGKCTERQAKYRLTKLEGLGLIEIRIMKYHGKGPRKVNVRLLIAEGAAGIKGRPDFTLNKNDSHQTILSHELSDKIVSSFIKEEGIKKKGKIYKQADKKTMSAEPLQTTALQEMLPGKIKGKTTPEDLGKLESQTNPSTPEVLEEYSALVQLQSSSNYGRYELWTALMTKHHHAVPAYVPPKVLKGYLDMLERIDYAVTTKGNESLQSFLEAVVGYWDTFAQLSVDGGAKSPPDKPSLAYVKKWAHVLINYEPEHEPVADTTPTNDLATPSAVVITSTSTAAISEAPAPVIENYESMVYRPPTTPEEEARQGEALRAWMAERLSAKVTAKIKALTQPVAA